MNHCSAWQYPENPFGKSVIEMKIYGCPYETLCIIPFECALGWAMVWDDHLVKLELTGDEIYVRPSFNALNLVVFNLSGGGFVINEDGRQMELSWA